MARERCLGVAPPRPSLEIHAPAQFDVARLAAADHAADAAHIRCADVAAREIEIRMIEGVRDGRCEDELEALGPPESNAEFQTVKLDMVLFNPIFGNAHGSAPALDEFIDKTDTVVQMEASASLEDWRG